VLVPLYVPHGTNCAAWSAAFATISAHPSMTFYTIISPISGPGSSVDSQPDADFISCVLQLRLSGTQTVLGWVDTESPSTGTVLGDIDTYAGWNNSYRPNGIFLVDVTPTASRVSTYQRYVSHATSMGFTFTVLDTGFATSSSYLDMVDLVNTYEGPYSSFDPSSLSGTLSKQSVTLKSAPTTGSYSGVISQLQSLGVEAVYITDAPDMGTPLPAKLAEFVDEVASVGEVRLFYLRRNLFSSHSRACRRDPRPPRPPVQPPPVQRAPRLLRPLVQPPPVQLFLLDLHSLPRKDLPLLRQQ
ncbi:Spherulation-specific family 4-domain-containing protein, partial [Mycena albidolilacea]